MGAPGFFCADGRPCADQTHCAPRKSLIRQSFALLFCIVVFPGLLYAWCGTTSGAWKPLWQSRLRNQNGNISRAASLNGCASGCPAQHRLRVTTKPQYLTSQSSLEPFRLLVTQLVCSRRQARQPTRCEEGTRSVRHVFVGGRCGGAAPAQGRPLAADRPKYNNEGRKDTFARLVQGCESVAAE